MCTVTWHWGSWGRSGWDMDRNNKRAESTGVEWGTRIMVIVVTDYKNHDSSPFLWDQCSCGRKKRRIPFRYIHLPILLPIHTKFLTGNSNQTSERLWPSGECGIHWRGHCRNSLVVSHTAAEDYLKCNLASDQDHIFRTVAPPRWPTCSYIWRAYLNIERTVDWQGQFLCHTLYLAPPFWCFCKALSPACSLLCFPSFLSRTRSSSILARWFRFWGPWVSYFCMWDI